MVVAVHNPSNLAMEEIKIAVPHGRFVVHEFFVKEGKVLQ
jgi:hypothetical protein